MKGCFRGFLFIILIALLAALWYFYARVERSPSASGTPTASTSSSSTWQPLNETDAAQGRVAVESLGQQSGPVFANLSAAQAASYIFLVVAKQLPPSARNAEAAILNDRLYVRSVIDLNELGGAGALGPIGMVLGQRDSVRLGGSIRMIKPGLGEFLVQDVKLGKLDVPAPLIPRMLAQMKRGKVVPGISPNGLAMVMPAYISDVRISDGRITLYKSVK